MLSGSIVRAGQSFSSWIVRRRTWSLTTFLLTAVAVAICAGSRVALDSAGATLSYAPFFPSVLFATLLGGVPAAVFAAWLSATVVLIGFTDRPDHAEAVNLVAFLGASALVIWPANLCRNALLELKRNEHARELLMAELRHRVNNQLALFQSIVRSSLSGEDRDKGEAIALRLDAVARANTLAWSSQRVMTLRMLLEAELQPYRASGAVSLEGTDVPLGPEAGRNLALVFHELATNAVKYGALRGDGGRLEVQLAQDGGRNLVSWRELNPRPVAPPQSEGFGTRMIRASLAAIGGSIEQDFRDEGLLCRIRFEPGM
ncbi:sensor histidine kinase [Bradyrhizobium sp. 83012]|uniref:histidine kinase n=1 Tax=Bradyrhizobium aeschynomenes TaxID=2734909 RepID=A0ABX2CKL0_9BRAD|nr:sensor histidine kinase [Bradyrhizobium aeschynomenes]NPU68714.1 sensor histidine kinase [Bradyrhizobium aeschynomenes]NPV19734.1 sensor histidine kinase [Bradyrhizobium aeschynomenes]